MLAYVQGHQHIFYAQHYTVLLLYNSLFSILFCRTQDMNSSNRANNYESTWTRRFIGAAIIQGAIIVGLTVFLILSQISILKPEVSRVIAAGGAGTWLTFGYVMYVVVGVVGMAVSALFYYYLEKVMGRYYSRHALAKIMAWIHLSLMNIGTTVTMGLLMYAGYIGGAATLPKI